MKAANLLRTPFSSKRPWVNQSQKNRQCLYPLNPNSANLSHNKPPKLSSVSHSRFRNTCPTPLLLWLTEQRICFHRRNLWESTNDTPCFCSLTPTVTVPRVNAHHRRLSRTGRPQRHRECASAQHEGEARAWPRWQRARCMTSPPSALRLSHLEAAYRARRGSESN